MAGLDREARQQPVGYGVVWCYLPDMEARMEVVRIGGEHESMLWPLR